MAPRKTKKNKNKNKNKKNKSIKKSVKKSLTRKSTKKSTRKSKQFQSLRTSLRKKQNMKNMIKRVSNKSLRQKYNFSDLDIQFVKIMPEKYFTPSEIKNLIKHKNMKGGQPNRACNTCKQTISRIFKKYKDKKTRKMKIMKSKSCRKCLSKYTDNPWDMLTDAAKNMDMTVDMGMLTPSPSYNIPSQPPSIKSHRKNKLDNVKKCKMLCELEHSPRSIQSLVTSPTHIVTPTQINTPSRKRPRTRSPYKTPPRSNKPSIFVGRPGDF